MKKLNQFTKKLNTCMEYKLYLEDFFKKHLVSNNHTLRVESTLVRVEITVVSAIITCVRITITMRAEITQFMYESHLYVSLLHS
jgi:hypothetical protein